MSRSPRSTNSSLHRCCKGVWTSPGSSRRRRVILERARAMVSPLEQLSAASGREFPNLLKAHERTSRGLSERRAKLAELPHDENVSIVLTGSWGRSEVTSGSDDDFILLVTG